LNKNIFVKKYWVEKHQIVWWQMSYLLDVKA